MTNTNQRIGMATPLVVTIILVAAALAGAALYSSRSASPEPSPTPQDAMMQAEGTEGDSMLEEAGVMMQDGTKEGDTMMESGVSFQATGTVLAGTTSPLIEFNGADYNRALGEGRTILLYFFANWCPICRVEFQDTEAAFRELSEPDVIGFRVNYNDDDTDDDEESLARQFGVAYQHTKVILVDGTPVLKDGSTWDRDRYQQEIGAILNP